MKLRTKGEQKAYLDGFERCAECIKKYLSDEGKKMLECHLMAVRSAIESKDIEPQEREVKMETSNFKDIKAYDSPTNGSIFLKTYPDSHLASIAYDDGICYVYVDLGGSRTRFTSDWWNATYKEACRTERN